MTDARVGKVGEKVLVQPTPQALVGKVGEKVLVQPTPQARVGKVGIKVLVLPNGAATGPTDYWWDDVTASFQPLDPQEFFWDGAAIQPVQSTTDGYWDGTAIQPLS
jgi:hypothetical protein